MAAESLLFLRQKDLAKYFAQVKRQLFSHKFSNLLPGGPGMYSVSALPVSKASEPCSGQKASAGAICGGAGTGGPGSLIFLLQERPWSAIWRLGAVSASQKGLLEYLDRMISCNNTVKSQIISRSL